jgi:acyl-CoA synthetase (AMP-forming)/AMP-acid ligase II
MHLDDLLHRQPPDRAMVIDPLRKTGYTSCQIREWSFRIGHGIKCHAPAAKRIAVLVPTSVNHLALLLALFSMDVVIIPLNARINETKCTYLINHSGADLLVTSRALIAHQRWIELLPCRVITIEDLLSEPFSLSAVPSTFGSPRNIQSPKLIMYTSGTTGDPKGVMHSEYAIDRKIADLSALVQYSPTDTFFSFLSYNTIQGMISGLLVPLFSGSRICISHFTSFLVPEFWRIVREYEITHFTSTPSILQMLKEFSHIPEKKPPSLKDIFCAAAPLPHSLLEWYYERWGLVVRHCYGMTETISWTIVPPHRSTPGPASCVGKPFNAEIIFVNGEGKQCPPGQTGELWIKSPSNMLGYLHNESATKAVLKAGGFIATGDLGCFDGEGNVFVSGRSKHVILRGGYTIFPREVEDAFCKHPDVSECACFGVPDDRYGERLIVALVLKSIIATTQHFINFGRDTLPPYIMPDDIYITTSLPRGETGKILIDELRNNYLISR